MESRHNGRPFVVRTFLHQLRPVAAVLASFLLAQALYLAWFFAWVYIVILESLSEVEELWWRVFLLLPMLPLSFLAWWVARRISGRRAAIVSFVATAVAFLAFMVWVVLQWMD